MRISCHSYQDQEHVFHVGGVWEQEIDMEPAENYDGSGADLVFDTEAMRRGSLVLRDAVGSTGLPAV